MYVKSAIFAALLFVSVVSACGKVDREELVMFSHSVTKDAATGYTIVQLNADYPDRPQESISIKVAVEGGSNMISYTAGGIELIDTDPDLSKLHLSGRGTFVLYPSPNRIREAAYSFMGEDYTMSFPGEDHSHWIHGIVRDDSAWAYDEPKVSNDSVSFKTRYVIDEKNPRFPAFPFQNTLTVEYTVLKDRVRVAYTVDNTGDKALGFGFGLHPYWRAIGGKDKCRIQVDLPWHMEATDDLLPTGKITDTKDSQWDLTSPKKVSELSLDDVYYGASPASVVSVFFDAADIRLDLKASADFTHVVVYTPDQPFFCVENQTCSTDAHNLYAQGLEKESNLQIAKSGETVSGFVDYILVRGAK